MLELIPHISVLQATPHLTVLPNRDKIGVRPELDRSSNHRMMNKELINEVLI